MELWLQNTPQNSSSFSSICKYNWDSVPLLFKKEKKILRKTKKALAVNFLQSFSLPKI